MSASLETFAVVNDASAGTTKKLQKQKILADYFRELSDEDLPIAVRYAGGQNFASTDERVLGVSGAIVSDVILRITKIDPREYRSLTIKHGEIGDALSVIWAAPDAIGGSAAPPQNRLTLIDLARAFDDLAETGNFARKKDIVEDLFLRALHPREPAYLAKIIFSDLRTGVREGVLLDAIAQAFGRERTAVQRAQLLTGDLGEVALLARRDKLGEAKLKLFHPIQFMLATPKETAADIVELTEGKPYFAEDKLDGIRAQIHKTGEGSSARIAIYTRTMDRTDESFPDVVESIRSIGGEFLLDGEIVPYRAGRVLPFAHIQKRLGRKNLTAKIIRENPAAFIAFDILYLNGEVLMDRPLRERRAALSKISAAVDGPPSPLPSPRTLGEGVSTLTPSPCIQGEGGGEGSAFSKLLTSCATLVATADETDLYFAKAREAGNEGLMLKDPESNYLPGRRGQAWLKLKTHLPTLDCVVTAAEYGHGKRKNSLSDYTFAVWDRDPAEADARLVNIGKAYSGVTDEEIAQLTKLFMEIAIEQVHGRVFLVRPQVVFEIAFDQIQPSERHNSGYALRFPRIKRIRWDKSPADADRLMRVVEIYQSAANTGRREGQAATEVVERTLFDDL